jgi:hypothetical protein
MRKLFMNPRRIYFAAAIATIFTIAPTCCQTYWTWQQARIAILDDASSGPIWEGRIQTSIPRNFVIEVDFHRGTISDYFAELSRRGKVERERREAAGEYLGRLPLGYHRERRSGGLEIFIDEHSAPLVRESFHLAGTGRLSLRKVLEEMTCRGLRGQRGEPLGTSTFWNMLSNPFYAGLLSDSISLGNWPAIIDPVKFGKVQGALAARRRSAIIAA